MAVNGCKWMKVVQNGLIWKLGLGTYYLALVTTRSPGLASSLTNTFIVSATIVLKVAFQIFFLLKNMESQNSVQHVTIYHNMA